MVLKKKIAKSNKYFIKNYDENSDIGYVPEADVKYLKRLHNFYNDLPFLPERMKTKKMPSACMQSV